MSYYLLEHRNPNGDHFYTTRRKGLKGIVVHCTAGLEDKDLIGPDMSAENTARYAATTSRAVSWQSGSDSDTWIDLLPYSYTAFQCVNYNSSTAGHEISKLDMTWSDEDPDWVRATIRMAAIGADGRGGLKKKALENGIPLRRATKAELDHAIATNGPPVGFVGHAELDPDRRTDPGRDFPWTMFFGFMRSNTTEDDFDMRTDADLITLLRKAVRLELTTLGTPSRTAVMDLAKRGAAEAVKGATEVTIYGDRRTDTGADPQDTHPENIQRVRDDMEAGFKRLDERLDQLVELFTRAPAEEPTP